MTSPKPITLEEIAAIREAIMRRVPPFNDYPEGAPIRLIRVDELDALAALSPAAQVPSIYALFDKFAPEKWRCMKCGCLWRLNKDRSWSLGPSEHNLPQRPCAICDNSPEFMNVIVPAETGDESIITLWNALQNAALAERGQDQSDTQREVGQTYPVGEMVNTPIHAAASDPTDQSKGGDALASECRLSRSDSSGSGNVVPGERASDQHARASSAVPNAPASEDMIFDADHLQAVADGALTAAPTVRDWCMSGAAMIRSARDEIARLQRWVDAYHAREDRIASLEAEVARLTRSPQSLANENVGLWKRIDELEAEVARLKDEGERDYKDMRRMQANFIDADHARIALESELARAKPVIEMARESAEDADDGDLSPFVQSRLMRLREAIRAYDKEQR